MTEDEAKTKWCPQTRVTGAGTEFDGQAWHTNRPSIADVDSKGFDLCAGSKCMAWRWTHIESEGWDNGPSQGYCGLAEQPS